MFCTKCGKELYDGDKFCAHCGAAVREPKRSRYDDVVFNPPFKIEAEKRTEEILKTTEIPKPASDVRETVAFDWNLEGFPSSQPRKTEAVDFNWDSVMERRNNSRSVAVEEPEPEPENEEPTLSIEELENELFGSAYEEERDAEELEPTIIAGMGKWPDASHEAEPMAKEESAPEPERKRTGDERFYTYNQKFDAFQELLDKERERLRNLEDSYKQNKEVMDYAWVGEVFPELDKSAGYPEPHVEDELPQTEPEPVKEPEPQKPLEVVAVEAPSLTMTIVVGETGKEAAAETEKKAKEKREEEEHEPSPSKTKLRYSDIFPRGLVNNDGTGPAGSDKTEQEVKKKSLSSGSIYDDLDDDDQETTKKHIFARIIIAVLIILIVIEGAILAIKFIAPDSKISLWANDMMLKAVDLIVGKDDGGSEDDPALTSNRDKEVYMTGLVEQASKEMKTIGEATFSADLKFNMIKDYSFEEISDAESFVDADWLTDEDGNSVTYGQKLVEALVKHYDSWQTANTDKSLVGINKLEIGEIRTGKEGFYSLCRVSYAGEDGNDVVKYQTAYLRISGDTMVINDIKEDKL